MVDGSGAGSVCAAYLPRAVERAADPRPAERAADPGPHPLLHTVVAPAVERVGGHLVAFPAPGGLVSRARREHFLLADCAVVDLTAPDGALLHALGMRDALGRASVLLAAEGAEAGGAPAHLDDRVAVRYAVTAAGAPADAEAATAILAETIRAALARASTDRTLALTDELHPPEIARLKTDVFRDETTYAAAAKARLAEARAGDADAVRAVEAELGDLSEVEPAVLVDLLLSYRAVRAWADVMDLVGRLPEAVAHTVLVREQYAMALNRAGRGGEAESVLRGVLAEHGPSSETCALLGRVYKDRWDAARGPGRPEPELLGAAVEAYLAGFEADWRDAYPGVNAVTLMELADPPDPRRTALLPVVTYAVRRRMAGGAPDYWDHATLLELAVLARDEDSARAALADALAAVRERWEPESTLRNLRLIRRSREERGEAIPAWIDAVEAGLREAAGA